MGSQDAFRNSRRRVFPQLPGSSPHRLLRLIGGFASLPPGPSGVDRHRKGGCQPKPQGAVSPCPNGTRPRLTGRQSGRFASAARLQGFRPEGWRASGVSALHVVPEDVQCLTPATAVGIESEHRVVRKSSARSVGLTPSLRQTVRPRPRIMSAALSSSSSLLTECPRLRDMGRSGTELRHLNTRAGNAERDKASAPAFPGAGKERGRGAARRAIENRFHARCAWRGCPQPPRPSAHPRRVPRRRLAIWAAR